VRIVGIGGGGEFDCPSGIADGWYDFDVAVYFGGGEFTVATMNGVPFNQVASQLLFEANPWEYAEGTTSYGIGVMVLPHGPEGSGNCGGIAVTLPVISHIELTIIADSVVTNEEMVWGTLKAKYFGGR